METGRPIVLVRRYLRWIARVPGGILRRVIAERKRPLSHRETSERPSVIYRRDGDGHVVCFSSFLFMDPPVVMDGRGFSLAPVVALALSLPLSLSLSALVFTAL